MPVRFVCLANSYKEGGRCIAGIVIDNNDKPVFEKGRRKWVRPICHTPHGEVPAQLVPHIKILDIIEIEVTGYTEEKSYQSENVFFNEGSIRVTGAYPVHKLDALCEDKKYVFGTRYPSVNDEVISELNYSLLFIRTSQFEVIEKTFEDSPGKIKIRLVFSYNEIRYDFSVTDPVFIHQYQKNQEFLENFTQLYLTLSLGVKWPATNRYYKLVAGVINSEGKL
jgi:hypothetical protein